MAPSSLPKLDWTQLSQLAFQAWLKVESPTTGELNVLNKIILLLPSRTLTIKTVKDVARSYGMDDTAVIDLTLERLGYFRKRFVSFLSRNKGSNVDFVERSCGTWSSCLFVLAALLPLDGPHDQTLNLPSIRVISALLRLVENLLPEHSRRHIVVFRIVERCFGLITALLDVIPDINAIHEALRRGLIASIRAASRRTNEMTEEGLHAMKTLIRKVLCKNLVFRSVLNELLKSFNTHRTDGQRASHGTARTIILDGSALCLEWNHFFKLLDHYAAALAYFHKSRRVATFSCGNVRNDIPLGVSLIFIDVRTIIRTIALPMVLGKRSNFVGAVRCSYIVQGHAKSHLGQPTSILARIVVSTLNFLRNVYLFADGFTFSKESSIRSSLEPNDIWFIVEQAYDELRRVLPASKNVPPHVTQVPLRRRGHIVMFTKDGNSRDIAQFDLETLRGADGAPIAIPDVSFTPGCASFGRPSSVKTLKKTDYVTSIMVVEFPIGSERKQLAFTVAFTHSALDGLECSCCLFHEHPVNEGFPCYVHRTGMNTTRV